MAVTETPWTPASWRAHEALQQPAWPDAARAEIARAQLRGMPPLVFAGEARALQDALADVAAGRAFLLQAGDCAESFHDTSAVTIREKLKILLQMSVVLTYAAALPVVKVGRIAGQFAKPRSAPTERVGDVDLPSFCGHLVNDDAPTAEARVPDPQRMLRAYDQSARTLNLLRAFAKGGFADITRVHEWNQEFVASSAEGRRYEQVASEIERALRFMTACGIDLAREAQLHQVDVWTSHEGLLLDYEEGPHAPRLADRRLVRLLGAHALDRRAHAAARRRARRLLRRRAQPARRQARSEREPARGRRAVRRLDPQRTPGRLTLITRMGASHVREALPPLLRAVREAGHPVVWSCDPMHANGIRTASGLKTRRFDAIMDELEGFVQHLPERGHLARRRAPRVHGRGRHRVPRRRRGSARGTARDALHDALRPAPERPPVARPGLPPGRADARRCATGVIQRLAIVGLGLMGGSLGLAARERGGRRTRRRLRPRPGRARGRARARLRRRGRRRPRGGGRRRRARRRCARRWPSCPRVLAELAALAPDGDRHRHRLDQGGRRRGGAGRAAPALRRRPSGLRHGGARRRRTPAPSCSRAPPGS